MGHVSCTIAAATVGAFCVAGVAFAQDGPNVPPELAGRWAAKERELVLDISRCANGWCGVEVDHKSCGKTVLRMQLTRSGTGNASLRGRLELASDARPYAVEVSYFERAGGGPIQLLINGNTGRTFEPWRRTFPFHEILMSTGPAQCRPDLNVS
jgi:hypothetical protein